ncbi:nucleoside triphosphate pyrophosphohydrolase [Texcoconibacillus texcoconensis]|uniref:Tetrapyrrole methylase family protein/MazG family protein n=1 Tax=Texcoconibacillus texcoconensis TaxID=1095777 RepID=A0A840QU76_9BACI|nr:nucleoside triphosphate pyrophosphohydrolase [Texcoconibacillus texcoconensis]MBB5174900.1 tetrapyrrole methylase family protein/MazG family protein [Texcoconibacillus texcoconensis]
MNDIHVIGLGAGDIDQLPLGIYRTVKKHEKIWVRTADHPVIEELRQEVGIESFDDIYTQYDDFESVYQTIVETLQIEAQKQPIIYAVPGHPLVAERTVQLLLEQDSEGVVKIGGGKSFFDDVFATLKIDPIEGFQMLDATSFSGDECSFRKHLIFCQVYDSFIASEVKLTLMDHLPDDYLVSIVTAAGSDNETVETVPLYELDRTVSLNNLTVVYVPPVRDEALLYHEFTTLKNVIATLRGPNGCPWDRKQTHESLKPYLLEEAYEVLEAIDEQDVDHLAEELGDVLLQVMLHAQIGEDDGMFTVADVIQSLTEKMIRRHPHVFADVEANDAEDVIKNWEEVKREERGEDKNTYTPLLSSVPKSLPALFKAYKLQKKAAKVGFDWGEEAPMWEKVNEEVAEWQTEIEAGNKERATKEFGDLLFALTNVARFHDINPEEALMHTNQTFEKRFSFIEAKLYENAESWQEKSLQQLDEFWEEAKREERKGNHDEN